MQIFEKFCAWSFDNGIFYVSGRDIMCMIVGLLIAVIIYLTIRALVKDGDI
ncbi:MAG: hypothetical protein J6S67_01605 [Methanobrevibacter sp.]|nr:hypothetical protein [Methanobrevibacter sp.]